MTEGVGEGTDDWGPVVNGDSGGDGGVEGDPALCSEAGAVLILEAPALAVTMVSARESLERASADMRTVDWKMRVVSRSSW